MPPETALTTGMDGTKRDSAIEGDLYLPDEVIKGNSRIHPTHIGFQIFSDK
jgi:hypothetical protein